MHGPYLPVLYYVCVCLIFYRCCATSGRASFESLPKGICRSVAEIHVERTQAGVEQPDALLVRNPLRVQPYDAIHDNCFGIFTYM